MKISKITLNNFRIYKGVNSILFDPSSDKNINIIAGRNGYGKTTFLTSLVWAFYGKLISEVEDKYRQDIRRSGGYENFLASILNREVLTNPNTGSKGSNKLSVEVELIDVLNPSIPCERITIKRSYNVSSKKESLKVLIDGAENELTKEVGYDVFINDFVLPREIAKFFFFDAEKIVTLAEAKSKDELRSLSRAYSEVLGIKKYEELKKNLESLLTKLRRDNGFNGNDKSRLEDLLNRQDELNNLITLSNERFEKNINEIREKKKLKDELQEKLIREGNSISVEELKEMKAERNSLKSQSLQIKSKLGKLMEIAPLVMAGRKLTELKKQLLKERAQKYDNLDINLLKSEITSLTNSITKGLSSIKLSPSDQLKVNEALEKSIEKYQKTAVRSNSVPVLLNFSEEQFLNFNALYDNIKGAYVDQLNSIVQEEKSNRVVLSRLTNKIKEAEARKDNKLAKKYREERESLQSRIEYLEESNNELLIEEGQYNSKIAVLNKQISELEKNFKLDEVQQKKYDVTTQLLAKLNELITRIKEEKKYRLEKSLKLGLSRLMHKENFIENVHVLIQEDVMQIELLDKSGNKINKDSLSKGEQQLYATALLKALVDESGIEFPVFIDSPLQKFDKHHSKNIIEEFYPSISGQVVLLPLLEKELSEKEFKLIKPNLNKTFIIENMEGKSRIENCKPRELFKRVKDELYAN